MQFTFFLERFRAQSSAEHESLVSKQKKQQTINGACAAFWPVLFVVFLGLDFLLEDGENDGHKGQDEQCQQQQRRRRQQRVWLLEANRLPGLSSSAQNKAAEDGLYDGMVTELLERLCVLTPLRQGKAEDTREDCHYWEPVGDEEDHHGQGDGANASDPWLLEAVGPTAPTWKNVVRFVRSVPPPRLQPRGRPKA